MKGRGAKIYFNSLILEVEKTIISVFFHRLSMVKNPKKEGAGLLVMC